MTLEKLISKGRKGVITLGLLGILVSFGCSTLTKREIATVGGEVLAEKGKSKLERFGSGFAFRWVDYNRNGEVDSAEEFVELKSRFRQNESIAITLLYEAEKPFHQNLKIYGPGGKIILEQEIDPFQKKRSTKQYLYYIFSPEKLANVHEDFEEWTTEWERPPYGGIAMGLNTKWVRRLLNIYGEGEYRAVWRIDGKIKDSIIFDIIY